MIENLTVGYENQEYKVRVLNDIQFQKIDWQWFHTRKFTTPQKSIVPHLNTNLLAMLRRSSPFSGEVGLETTYLIARDAGMTEREANTVFSMRSPIVCKDCRIRTGNHYPGSRCHKCHEAFYAASRGRNCTMGCMVYHRGRIARPR